MGDLELPGTGSDLPESVSQEPESIGGRFLAACPSYQLFDHRASIYSLDHALSLVSKHVGYRLMTAKDGDGFLGHSLFVCCYVA